MRSRRWDSARMLVAFHVVCVWPTASVARSAFMSSHASAPPRICSRSASWAISRRAASSWPAASTVIGWSWRAFTSRSIVSIWMPGATRPSLSYQWRRFSSSDGWIFGLAFRVSRHTSRSICARRRGPTLRPVCCSSCRTRWSTLAWIWLWRPLNASISSCGTPSTSWMTACVPRAGRVVHAQPNSLVSRSWSRFSWYSLISTADAYTLRPSSAVHTPSWLRRTRLLITMCLWGCGSPSLLS